MECLSSLAALFIKISIGPLDFIIFLIIFSNFLIFKRLHSIKWGALIFFFFKYEINLRADLSEYIGHEQIMTFDYENQEVLAKFPSTIKIELSKNTKLFFDLTQISLFDAKTEERI